ncbi:hypothetical protein BG006_003649, partial [Podila minutissima]
KHQPATMSSASTVCYSGLPADPNAEAYKMFTEWANQKDGLAMILKYCQTKSGFIVGSNNPVPFAGLQGRTVSSSRLDKTLSRDMQLTAEDLGPSFHTNTFGRYSSSF